MLNAIINDEPRMNQEEAMICYLKSQQSNEILKKIKKEKDARKRHARLESRKSYIESRMADRVPNMKEQMENSLKLLKFVADYQLTLTQVNGQRKLGPPPGWTGPPPGPKCEIFVGSIPRNYYEPEIVRTFSRVGRIYELRLMMEFSGVNRGYCFIMYTTEEEAVRAVRELDQHEIYPGKRIGVVASTNNCRLFINQLPRVIDSETIIRRIYEIADDVEKVAVYRNLYDYVYYVLVSFKTHRSTAMGRRRLMPEAATLFKNCEVNIEWANPNMTPFNVFEESGTCDEHGNVKIMRTFIEPVKSKKVLPRMKRKTMSNTINNQELQKLIDAPIRKGRPIRAATIENSLKSCDRSSCRTLEECRAKDTAQRNHSMTELASNEYGREGNFWDINGNLKHGFDQSLLFENFEKDKTQQDRSGASLPCISTYLNKARRSKTLKWNNAQKGCVGTFGTYDNMEAFPENFSDVPCNVINKHRLDYSYKSTNQSVDPLSLPSKEFQFFNTWDAMDGNLLRKLSDALKITNDHDGTNSISHDQSINAYKNEQRVVTENNIDPGLRSFSTNSVFLNEIGRKNANGFSQPNYYQNSSPSSPEQKNGMFYLLVPTTDTVYNLPAFNEPYSLLQKSNPNRDYSSTLLNDAKSTMINQNCDWYSPASLPSNGYPESRKISDVPTDESPNGCQYANNYQTINGSQVQNYDTVLDHFTPKSEHTYGYENHLNSMMYRKDTILANKKPQFGQDFQKL